MTQTTLDLAEIENEYTDFGNGIYRYECDLNDPRFRRSLQELIKWIKDNNESGGGFNGYEWIISDSLKYAYERYGNLPRIIVYHMDEAWDKGCRKCEPLQGKDLCYLLRSYAPEEALKAQEWTDEQLGFLREIEQEEYTEESHLFSSTGAQ